MTNADIFNGSNMLKFCCIEIIYIKVIIMSNITRYSIIMYNVELLEENIEYIIDVLKKGIIVHLFLTNTLKDELELNEYSADTFDDAIKNKLLFLYENQEEVLDYNEIIACDNYINNQRLYNILCRKKDSEFNSDQYEIITAEEDSNYIIVSGAGTGKTTTMINRLIYLRKKRPRFTFDKVALITFTNKASRDMRERLIEVLERYYKGTKNPEYLDMMDEATRCNISTIHGFSKSIMNQYGKRIGINKNIEVKSFKYYRKKAIIEALDYLYKNHKDLYDVIKYYPHYDIEAKLLSVWEKLDNFSIDVNSLNYTVDFGDDDKNFSEIVKIVIQKAQELLEENKDYQLEISDLMKKLAFKELFHEVKNKYELIMVDEFQDSDNIQIDFVANFCSFTGANLIVVGDEKQSIYRFRGAEHTAFSTLRQSFENNNMTLKEFTMVRNYRTDGQLLKEINEIFINIDERVDRFTYKEKDYIYSFVNSDKPSKIQYISLPEYNDETADFFHDLLNNKGSEEYVAVLLRSNQDIKDFKEFCDKKSIPCRVDVSGSFYRHQAVRDFYVMIKALIESKSNSIMYSFIETPYINKRVNKEKILLENNDEISSYLSSILQQKNWSKYQNLVNEINILALIDQVVQELNPIKGYYTREYLKAKVNGRDYKKIAKIKTLEYKLNLEHLLYIVKENFSDNISSISSIQEFLKLKISTDNIVDERKPSAVYERDIIQCLTVHKSKGLEYDYVVLPKLTNKFITSKSVDVIVRNNEKNINVGFKVRLGDDEYKNSYYMDYLKDENSEIIGEEARLLYVAMTRCKRKLYLNSVGLVATEGANNWKSLIGGAKTYV